MNAWEISQIFQIADHSKQGAIDMNQWKIFHGMFIKRFERADEDGDLLLDEREFARSMEDVSGLWNFRLS